MYSILNRPTEILDNIGFLLKARKKKKNLKF